MAFSKITFIKIGVGIIAVLALLLGIAVWWGGSSTVDTSEPNFAGDAMFLRPNMSVVIATVFDAQNADRALYDWAIIEEDDGSTTLAETSAFERYGQVYEFVLASKKQNPSDDKYTIADYLTLTLNVEKDGQRDEIVYVDLGADGELDSVYLNDVMLVEPGVLVEAQNQYTTELVVARDHMLGK